MILKNTKLLLNEKLKKTLGYTRSKMLFSEDIFNKAKKTM